jgi:hypothetical protein
MIGKGNIAIGHASLIHSEANDYLIAIGDSALYKNGTNDTLSNFISDCIAIGRKSLFNNISGYNNLGIGNHSLHDNLTGHTNIAIGNDALKHNDSGRYNVGIGSYSLTNNIDGHRNVAIGRGTLGGNTFGNHHIGDDNVAVGHRALHLNETGGSNTAVGSDALTSNIEGYGNCALGLVTLFENRSGDWNTALGTGTLQNHWEGDDNTAVGASSLNADSTGQRNTAIGARALASNKTGFNNLAIGYRAGDNITSGYQNISIGYKAYTASAVDSHQMVIGNIIYGVDIDGQESAISSGNIGIGTDDPAYRLEVDGAFMLQDMSTPSAAAGHSGIYSNGGELNALDDMGNSTTISPHHFSLVKPSEPMAWSFYSRNENLNKQVNVDMMKALRLIEEISGERLVYIADLEGNEIRDNVPGVSLYQERLSRLEKQNKNLQEHIDQQRELIESQQALLQDLVKRIEILE